MDIHTRNVIRSVEKAIARLATACRKNGALYSHNPKAVAQVNRTSKWLLNAVRSLGDVRQQPKEIA